MINRNADVAEVQEDRAGTVEFLVEMDVARADAEALLNDDLETLQTALATLAKHELNQTAGGVSILAGKRFFPLKKTIFSALVIAAALPSLGFSLVIAVPRTHSMPAWLSRICSRPPPWTSSVSDPAPVGQ